MIYAQHWLMKTEPEVFSFQDLADSPNGTDHWDGIRNYQARNFMRDQFQVGQEVFIYHSNCKEPGIAGVAKVVKEAYPDHTALDPKSPYFCKRSSQKGESIWCMVDVKATHFFKNYVSLRDLREISSLEGLALLQKGQRLSIQPVMDDHWQIIWDIGQPFALSAR